MELTQNLWERYGFTDNPYDTKALSLSEAASLSVQAAYIPRAEGATTADLLTNFLRNPGGGRIVVEGDPGVGKTTFVNYHRQRWETAARHKLISPAGEISVREGWTERDLLLNLLASLSALSGLTVALSGMADPFGSAAYFGGMGVVLVAGGGLTLRNYLRQTQPGAEGE